MATTIEFIDSAFPSSLGGSLHGATGLVFYAGGDTPHTWAVSEIAQFKAQYLLPVWVASFPKDGNDGATQAAAFLKTLTETYKAPKGVLVALDSETSIDPVFVAAFVKAVNAGGYPVIDYGSESFVHGNMNPDGYYWGADWTGRPGILPTDQATQYVSFSAFDLSDFGGALPLWNTTGVKPPVTSGIPTHLSAVVAESDYLITWAPVPDPNANGVAGNYEWQVELYKGGGVWEVIRQGISTRTSATAPGLQVGRQLRYRVSGGNWSAWVPLNT